MDGRFFEDMKAYLGFTQADAQNLDRLRSDAKGCLPEVAKRFYRAVLDHPRARSVFEGGTRQMEALHETLKVWLQELFDGEYGPTYYAMRARIGAAHVRVGLPQEFMVLGMEIIRRELIQSLELAIPGFDDAQRQSVQKILALDLAIMAQNYQAIDADRIRRSERAQMEEQLTQAQHLARIGQLAASLAHEIKNPLAGISGAIQVIEEAMAESDPHRPIIGEILTQIGRLDATVKDLLLYARPTPPAIRKMSLERLVERILTLLREEPTLRDIDIEVICASDLPPIDADEDKIEQLLVNLLLNAAHASSQGATITVRLSASPTDVTIRIVDRGAGMTADVRRRALEPFFTTKAKGTGLGLAICRRIAETHGGSIGVESQVGMGTTVSIKLPRFFVTVK